MSLLKKINPRIFRVFSNRYILVTVAAVVWMVFLDRYDLFSQIKMAREISKLKDDVEFYQKELEKTNEERLVFRENRAEVERFAREQYLMKKDNEDLFLIVQEEE